MHRRCGKCIQTFGLISARENQLEDFRVDERLIFKTDVKEIRF
jgi:hypothetical protein